MEVFLIYCHIYMYGNVKYVTFATTIHVFSKTKRTSFWKCLVYIITRVSQLTIQCCSNVSTTFSESLEIVCKLHWINGFHESYTSVATTLSETYGNVAYLLCCNVIQEHCSNVEQHLWKCSHLMLPQRHTRKLQKHCHNVEGKLWKRWHIKLLQHIPGKFQECSYNVAARRCMKTSP